MEVFPLSALQSIFSLKFLQSLDKYIEFSFEVLYVWSKVNDDLVMTEVSFKHAIAIGHNVKIKLEKSEFTQLLQKYDRNIERIQRNYIERVEREVTNKINWLKKNKTAEKTSSTKSKVSSNDYTPQLANEMAAYFDGLSENDAFIKKVKNSQL